MLWEDMNYILGSESSFFLMEILTIPFLSGWNAEIAIYIIIVGAPEKRALRKF